MEILQGFYFVWIKLLNGMGLTIAYILIPALTIGSVLLAWPQDKNVMVKPTFGRAVWIVSIALFGLISYGAQLNWIFNNQPSPIMDMLRKNFYQNFEEHLHEQESKKPVIRTDLRTEIRRYELISYDPPKHFYVTLEDVKTHQVFTKMYVSKHCNSASTNKIGDEYNIRVTTYALSDQPNLVFLQFHNLYDTFCK